MGEYPWLRAVFGCLGVAPGALDCGGLWPRAYACAAHAGWCVVWALLVAPDPALWWLVPPAHAHGLGRRVCYRPTAMRPVRHCMTATQATAKLGGGAQACPAACTVAPPPSRATHHGWRRGAAPCRRVEVVTAQAVVWCSGFVLMTLLINAPLLTPLMTALGLNATSPIKQQVSQAGPTRPARHLCTWAHTWASWWGGWRVGRGGGGAIGLAGAVVGGRRDAAATFACCVALRGLRGFETGRWPCGAVARLRRPMGPMGAPTGRRRDWRSVHWEEGRDPCVLLLRHAGVVDRLWTRVCSCSALTCPGCHGCRRRRP